MQDKSRLSKAVCLHDLHNVSLNQSTYSALAYFTLTADLHGVSLTESVLSSQDVLWVTTSSTPQAVRCKKQSDCDFCHMQQRNIHGPGCVVL